MKFSKQIADTPFARISFVLGVVISLAVTVGLSRPKTVEDHVMEAMGLKSCQLTNIDQVSKSEMALTMNGENYTIDYTFFPTGRKTSGYWCRPKPANWKRSKHLQ